MTLYDIMKLTNDEITVWDKDYDIETYFYGILDSDDEKDDWDNAMIELSGMLDIVKFSKGGVTVNLSEVIEKSLPILKTTDLFIKCDLDNIMDDIERILAGNVSEKWLRQFVDVLKECDDYEHINFYAEIKRAYRVLGAQAEFQNERDIKAWLKDGYIDQSQAEKLRVFSEMQRMKNKI